MLTRRSLFGILAGAVAAMALPFRAVASYDDMLPIQLARLPGTSPFWGPKMREAIGIAKLLGLPAGVMSPAKFASAMDEMTGQTHRPGSSPEDAAAVWLPRLRHIVRNRGLVK